MYVFKNKNSFFYYKYRVILIENWFIFIIVVRKKRYKINFFKIKNNKKYFLVNIF